MSATVTEDFIHIIRSEYGEMPGLRLTPQQAGRLWNLDPVVARALLDALVEAGHLVRGDDGRYGRPESSW